MNKNSLRKVREVMDKLDGTTTPPLCRDCKFVKRTELFSYTLSKCKHPKSQTRKEDQSDSLRSLVDGKERFNYEWCTVMRMSHQSCGTEGKLFERKPDEVSPVRRALQYLRVKLSWM